MTDAKAVSFDTNLIIRMLVKRDHPRQSEAIARSVASNTAIHLADLTIVESVFVLAKHYQLPRPAIAQFFRAVFRDAKFHCNRPLFDKAFRLYTEHPALSFEDCCLSVYAELNKATPLLTFDKKLAAQLQHAALLKM